MALGADATVQEVIDLTLEECELNLKNRIYVICRSLFSNEKNYPNCFMQKYKLGESNLKISRRRIERK